MKELKSSLEYDNDCVSAHYYYGKYLAEKVENYELAKSVPCIGKVSAIYLLMCTDNYKKLKTYT